MKRWFFLAALTVALGVTAICPPQQAFSQPGEGRSKIFMFTQDFPPDILFEHPIPPVKETRFWQLVDQSMRNKSSLELTESLEDANYRVELECAGIVWCTKVRVNLMTPNRDVLATYSIPGRPMMLPPNLSLFAKRLTETLDYRVAAIEQGGLGNYGLTRYRFKYTGGRKVSSAKPAAAAKSSTP